MKLSALKAFLESECTDASYLDASSRIEKHIIDCHRQYGQLPTVADLQDLFSVQFPSETMPWEYYKKEIDDQNFIAQAAPILERYNQQQVANPTQALLSLRESLTTVLRPVSQVRPVSIIRDTSRIDHFADVSNTRYKTGLEPLDTACGGLSARDDFMVISARLGVGKSVLAIYIASNMCMAGLRVGFYSGEMSEHEVGARADAVISGLSNYQITRGVRPAEWDEHVAKLNAIEGDLLVLTPKMLGRNARPSDIRKFVEEEHLDVVFIDQLSLMQPDNFTAREAYQRFEELSLQLISLKQELGIPFVVVSQLNREAARQEADASNISGSDRIGQDATIVLALTRKDDTFKIKVLKARSFRLPQAPWEFLVDIDRGKWTPTRSALEAIRARASRAEQAEQARTAVAQRAASIEEEDLW